MSGNYVRSKSEVFIDMVLTQRGIPFRYECELEIGGSIFYPDFTILNRRTLKVYYWEHCGKMDDPKYVYDFNQKLYKYTRNNIYPGKSLLLSFEGKNCSLQMGYVDSMIKEYLV